MKKTLLFILIISIFGCASYKINENILSNKYWGEINDNISKHRGKAGLIIMKLNSNYTFKAFENTDFGAAVMQKGKWNIKSRIVTFDVQETINYDNNSKMKGKILSDKEIGVIKYEIKEMTKEKLILYNKKLDKELVFELSELKYGI